MSQNKKQPTPEHLRQQWIEQGTLPATPPPESDETARETYRQILWTERLLQPPQSTEAAKSWVASLDRPSEAELQRGAQHVLQALLGQEALASVDWEAAQQKAQTPPTTETERANAQKANAQTSHPSPQKSEGIGFWQQLRHWIFGPQLAWGGLAILLVISATTIWQGQQAGYIGKKGKGSHLEQEKVIRLRFGISSASEKLPSQRGKDQMSVPTQSFLYFLLEKKEAAGHLAILRMDGEGHLRRLYPRPKSDGFEAKGMRRWILSHKGIALRYPVRWSSQTHPTEGSPHSTQPKDPKMRAFQRIAFFAVWSKTAISAQRWEMLLTSSLSWGESAALQTQIAQHLALSPIQVDGFQIQAPSTSPTP
ncbi:MAG: hypothetical protein H6728_17620 [Myxococcales bacterium]|nr:hypothetical protein [Myxococcales bacterium]